MPNRVVQGPGPLSQAAVTTFVLGVIQTTISAIMLFFIYALVNILSSFSQNISTSGWTPNGQPPTGADFIRFVILSVWGIIGLFAGFTAVSATHNGKSGDALGIVGILLNVGSLGINAYIILF